MSKIKRFIKRFCTRPLYTEGATVLIPLIQGAILLSEAINHAVNQ
ncbi:hypothetical protein I568_00041 [Enterococcus columbae DSM 7374 = ATCC 51263]|uniref:Uncharacterized protein n=1 Tax=Enterococcus columbae DSM 7374 = ATCC 51263 TaxID=1121865 RepID=S1NFA6_9ENTE|nr:hypothetical protein OMW_02234 [Enterococcus columbae DSM 7374 = ATCC 51263]EOW87755.1 hypothetical protein I568_00041 [Enterococcus columbae DSM 7374 = ATCC 51263]